jgi:acetyl-CoA carboxylase biotin carboxyl carrier protein
MDIKKIKSIIELIKDSGIAEIEISEGEDKLRISTINNTQIVNTQITHTPNHAHYITNDINKPAQNYNLNHEITKSPDIEAKLEQNSNISYITSPMVGTFYSASSPNSSPFVTIGQEIKSGQVLCIVEAMKLMNQIEAENNCIIKEILVKDGMAVEYGQKLFAIELQ